MDIPNTAEVVIIGGGVMGASTAYHLASLGVRDVVLLEQGYLAGGPTGKSLANIRPYHAVEETAKIIKRANEIYLNFEEIVGGDIEFRKLGRVWAEPDSKKQIIDAAVSLSKSVGITADFISIEELSEMMPALNADGLGVAVHFPDAGYSNPGAVTVAYASRAKELGAQIYEETRVTGIEVASGKVGSVTTDKGQISTSAVVNCAGIWAPKIGRMVGLEIPITPTRGQGVVLRLPWDLPSFTPIFHDGRTDYIFRCEPVNLINMVDTLEILEPEVVDPDTMPEDADESTLVKALDKGSRTFPALERGAYRGGYSCAYDITPDESPIIEQSNEVQGFYNLVGWGGLGMQQAPVAGELMAELIITGSTSLVDVSIFGSRRFKENRPLPSAWLFGEIGIH